MVRLSLDHFFAHMSLRLFTCRRCGTALFKLCVSLIVQEQKSHHDEQFSLCGAAVFCNVEFKEDCKNAVTVACGVLFRPVFRFT